MSQPKSTNKIVKKCILNCPNAVKFFGFPEKWEACKVWLKILGMDAPSSRPKLSSLHLCTSHFSSHQLTNYGRNITPISIPDRNIPGKENPPEDDIESIKPAEAENPYYSNKTTQNTNQCIMITSDSSRCYLKCKTYKSLHKFPQDLPSYKVWVRQLGLPETTKLTRRSNLCDNHFSPAMRTLKTISRCAVPDLYLPSQCTFNDEFAKPPIESVTSTTHRTKVGDKPTTSGILVSPDNILNNIVISSAQKESTGLPLQTSVMPSTDVVFPDNYKNGLLECVLKCSDSKILYRFPNVESRRQLWLSQIGLTHCLCNTRICSRHFSEKMLSNKRLTNSSYPDINIPDRTKVVSLPVQDEASTEQQKIQELPQFICILTVFTQNPLPIMDPAAAVTKYMEYTVDKNIPKRERGVQVEVNDLVQKVNIGVSADDEYSDEDGDFEIVENINFEQQPNLVRNTFKSQMYLSKSKDMFECLKCGEILLDQESFINHMNSHNELNRLCFYCGRMFASGLILKKHERKVHSMELKPLLRCPKEHCHKAFHSRRCLIQHLDEHALPTKHFCVHCGRLFFSSLKLHCHLLACRPKLRRCRIKS